MAMKNSNELLSDIFGVLSSIDRKMDALAEKMGSPGVGGIALGTYLGGGKGKGKKGGDIGTQFSDDTDKIKKSMKGFNLVRFNSMIESMEKYNKKQYCKICRTNKSIPGR